jgi:hypothetical protein
MFNSLVDAIFGSNPSDQHAGQPPLEFQLQSANTRIQYLGNRVEEMQKEIEYLKKLTIQLSSNP